MKERSIKLAARRWGRAEINKEAIPRWKRLLRRAADWYDCAPPSNRVFAIMALTLVVFALMTVGEIVTGHPFADTAAQMAADPSLSLTKAAIKSACADVLMAATWLVIGALVVTDPRKEEGDDEEEDGD